MEIDQHDQIVERLKAASGLKKKKDIAELFGISPGDYGNREKRGTLLPLIVEWGIENSINMDWLLRGEGPSGGKGDSLQKNNSGKDEKKLDLDLLKAAIEAVDIYLDTTDQELSSEPKAKLISLLYERFTEKGIPEKLDPKTAEDLLVLIIG